MSTVRIIIDGDDGSLLDIAGPVTITVKRPPGAPIGVTASASGTTVDVGWAAPDDTGGLPLDGYVVTLTSGALSRVVAVDAPTTAATITSVAPGTWTATVVAHNERGTSPASVPVTVTVAAPPPPPVATTLFGAAVSTNAGESYAAALARVDAAYGPLQISRVFYPGMPAAWPGNAGLSGRPVIVSFKAAPATILSGSADAGLRAWFASAPTSRPVYWSYYHEPEDNIAAGEFAAVDYRAAWVRIAGLARAVGNPRLRATLILMAWTLNTASGRRWQDYYPGADTIDVLGWDCYNGGASKGTYNAADVLFAPVRSASVVAGKPWGLAEFGSLLVAGDTRAARAAWLRSCAAWLRTNGAAFCSYFDSSVGGEYRLLDASSRDAWKAVIAGS